MAGNRDPQRRPVLYDLKNQQLFADPAIGSALRPVTLGGTFLSPADIGVTVQGYDATTLKAADIGATVQGYDADTAKLDIEQAFTARQTFSAAVGANGGSYGTNGDVLTSQGPSLPPIWRASQSSLALMLALS